MFIKTKDFYVEFEEYAKKSFSAVALGKKHGY